MSIDRCQMIDLPKIHDPRGNLTFIEGGVHVPFDIQRFTTFTMSPAGRSEVGMHRRLHPVHCCDVQAALMSFWMMARTRNGFT